MTFFDLVPTLVLLGLIGLMYRKNKKTEAETNKRISELEVRIVARIEDRLTVLEEQAILDSEIKISPANKD